MEDRHWGGQGWKTAVEQEEEGTGLTGFAFRILLSSTRRTSWNKLQRFSCMYLASILDIQSELF
jgi:hypothetical protein